MALANVAVLMAQWGYKVLAVDWDLEAPGLDRYFGDLLPAPARRVSGPGIVEIATAVSEEREADWREYVIRLPVPEASKALDFIPAGRSDSDYARRLQRLDWEVLFLHHNFGSRLEAIRNDWLKTYDHVLIDSRTGITDIGGICTIYLPDILVTLFSANHQSLEGVADVMSRARRARSTLPVDRGALVCVPVPARDESRTEYEQSLEWRRRYERQLRSFYTDFLPRDVSPVDALDVLRIPNVPYWSFGERLPVLKESPADPSGVAYYYNILAKLLTTELSWADSAPAYATSQGEAMSTDTAADMTPTATGVGGESPIVLRGGERARQVKDANTRHRSEELPEIDIALLAELGGEEAAVERRIGLIRSVLDRLVDSASTETAIQAAVFGYREHDGPYRRDADKDHEKLIVGRELGSAQAARDVLSRQALWQAVRMMDGAAAPIEDALHELSRTSSWRPEARHVLLIVGERPPRPPTFDPRNPLILPCPHRYAWNDELRTLRDDHLAVCMAVVDDGLDVGTSYRVNCWAELGEDGIFAADDNKARLIDAVTSFIVGQLGAPIARPVRKAAPSPKESVCEQ
jgi:cellulose biosynthesis protein BcsQ